MQIHVNKIIKSKSKPVSMVAAEQPAGKGTPLQLQDNRTHSSAVIIQKKNSTTSQLQTENVTASTKFISSNSEKTEPGKTSKEHFLNSLQHAVSVMADGTLSKINQTSANCPYIAYWFKLSQSLSPQQIEANIRRYAPTVQQATTWEQCIAILTERTHTAFVENIQSGSLQGVPAEVPKDLESNDNSLEKKKGTSAIAQLCPCCDDDVQPVAPPPRLWNNIPARFQTLNTLNAFGNSTYTVTANGVNRHAPINTVRAPAQVNNVHPNRHICYVTHAVKGVLRANAGVAFVARHGNTVTLHVGGQNVNVALAPQVGLEVFDFTYDPHTQTMTGRHPGHAVHAIL